MSRCATLRGTYAQRVLRRRHTRTDDADDDQGDWDDDHIDDVDDGYDDEPVVDRTTSVGPGGRMLGTVIAVALMGAVLVGGYQWFERERDVVPDPVGWSAIAVTDRPTGTVTMLDRELNTIASVATGSPISSVVAGGGTLTLARSDAIIVHPFDDDPVIVPIPPGHVVAALPTNSDLVLTIGDEAGGDLTIVTNSTNVIPIVTTLGALTGEPTPRYFTSDIRHDTAGNVITVADTVNFQTILITTGAQQPVYLPDLALGVHPELIVTNQTVGDRAELGMFDLDGTRIRTIATPAVRGGTITADGQRFVFVTRDGRVMRVERISNNIDELSNIDIGTDHAVNTVTSTLGGSRLWAMSDHRASLLALDGDILGRWVTNDPVSAEPLTAHSRCAIIHTDGTSRLIDLIDGRELTEVPTLTGLTQSRDGCLITGVSVGNQRHPALVGAFGVLNLGERRVLAMAPDSSAVILSNDAQAVLVSTNDLRDANNGGPAANLRAIGPSGDLYSFIPD